MLKSYQKSVFYETLSFMTMKVIIFYEKKFIKKSFLIRQDVSSSKTKFSIIRFKLKWLFSIWITYILILNNQYYIWWLCKKLKKLNPKCFGNIILVQSSWTTHKPMDDCFVKHSYSCPPSLDNSFGRVWSSPILSLPSLRYYVFLLIYSSKKVFSFV